MWEKVSAHVCMYEWLFVCVVACMSYDYCRCLGICCVLCVAFPAWLYILSLQVNMTLTLVQYYFCYNPSFLICLVLVIENHQLNHINFRHWYFLIYIISHSTHLNSLRLFYRIIVPILFSAVRQQLSPLVFIKFKYISTFTT